MTQNDAEDYLGYNLEPCFNLHARETFAHGNADVPVIAIFEPQSQKTQSILKRICTRKRNGFEEAWQTGKKKNKQNMENQEH
jgi:hypothetical protein